jgi:hypothetical protein
MIHRFDGPTAQKLLAAKYCGYIVKGVYCLLCFGTGVVLGLLIMGFWK